MHPPLLKFSQGLDRPANFPLLCVSFPTTRSRSVHDLYLFFWSCAAFALRVRKGLPRPPHRRLLGEHVFPETLFVCAEARSGLCSPALGSLALAQKHVLGANSTTWALDFACRGVKKFTNFRTKFAKKKKAVRVHTQAQHALWGCHLRLPHRLPASRAGAGTRMALFNFFYKVRKKKHEKWASQKVTFLRPKRLNKIQPFTAQ